MTPAGGVPRGRRHRRQGPDSIEARGERLHIPAHRAALGPARGGGRGHLHGRRRHRGARARRSSTRASSRWPSCSTASGSAAVESLAEYVNDLLCQAGAPREGVKVTNRISPGYAGWDTRRAGALFRLCPGEPIGVTPERGLLHDAGQDASRFLVGIGPEARVDHYFTQCRRCWMRDCAYRRAPAAVTVRR